MANVLLISCNTTEEPYPVYPLGMTIVSESVRKRGNKVTTLDLLAREQDSETLETAILREEPDVIGLSLRNVDNVVHHAQESYADNYRKIVTLLRSLSNAPIVLGGSAFTLLPKEFMKETCADFGIIGPGEDAFPTLVDSLSRGNAPREKVIQGGFKRNESIGALTRAPELAAFYLRKGGMLNVQTKRGCPHRCTYCSYPVIEGSCYRFREPSDVVDEIEALVKGYDADYFSIVDSVFNDDDGNFLSIAEELVRRDSRTPWMCFLRPGSFSGEIVSLLKRAGLASVEWGIDGSTDETLEGMGKDFVWNDVVESISLFRNEGIANALFVIFGGPGETGRTFEIGLRNIEALENSVVFAGAGVRIYPNTPIYGKALAEGAIRESDNLLVPVYYFSPGIDSEYIERALEEVSNRRLDFIFDTGIFLEKIKAFHALGYRGPVWDFLLKKAGPGRRERSR
jgi:radical SAM superfamily enzyme YgiQ (UPF0313 family)